jgi:PAS domain S-box-containing protein
MFSRSKKKQMDQDSIREMERLKQYQEVLALLMRYAGVGLWNVDIRHGKALHDESQWLFSEEFRCLLGFHPDDRVGFPDDVHSWLDRLHPDDVQEAIRGFEAMLADRSGKTKLDLCYRLKTKDGSCRWFRAVGGAARNANGEAERACGSIIDIQNQKMAEEAERRSIEQRALEIAQLAESIEADVDQARSNAETVASASQELASSIAEISRHVVIAENFLTNARDKASEAHQIVQSLGVAAGRIGAVITLINEIASKTNLLALNAMIEAARAGESGKGFTVVANEVKALATQTAQATGDIAAQIHSVQVETARAQESIANIERSNADVQRGSGSIAAAIEQQTAATREIAMRAAKVEDEMTHIYQTVSSAAAGVKTGAR